MPNYEAASPIFMVTSEIFDLSVDERDYSLIVTHLVRNVKGCLRNIFQLLTLSFSDLRSKISPSISTRVLLDSLKFLKARSLIERTAADSGLQPLLRDYAKERFVW